METANNRALKRSTGGSHTGSLHYGPWAPGGMSLALEGWGCAVLWSQLGIFVLLRQGFSV